MILLSAVPGALGVLLLVFAVREPPPRPAPEMAPPPLSWRAFVGADAALPAGFRVVYLSQQFGNVSHAARLRTQADAAMAAGNVGLAQTW
ncbi:MAG: hypothetical protein WDN04_01220 [Rhodospirillales bacterium]